MKVLVLILMISVCQANAAQSCISDYMATDTIKISDECRFHYTQLILPVAMVTVGAVGTSTNILDNVNNSIRDKFAGLRGAHYIKADDYIQYLPVASYLGMGAIGVDCRHEFKERFAVGATAYLAMGIMVNSIKYTVKAKRPDSNARNSFPSGHSATAFMGAELIRQEYGTPYAIGAYTLAAAVAILRIYNDRHWLNDVIAGAGIGILSARIGYWLLPVYRKWFHWDKTVSTVLLPNINFASNNIGINFIADF